MTKKKKKEKARVAAYKFAHGATATMPLADAVMALMRQYGAMASDDNPIVRAHGEAGLRHMTTAPDRARSKQASGAGRKRRLSVTGEQAAALARELGYPGKMKYEDFLAQATLRLGCSESTIARRLADRRKNHRQ